MIIDSMGVFYNQNGTLIYTGSGTIPCPLCGGKLVVHGTCIRKYYNEESFTEARLRVMECKVCGKTHRELPAGTVPYKRMNAERLDMIAREPQETHLWVANSCTWYRTRRWRDWFVAYGKGVLASLGVPGENEIDANNADLVFLITAVTNSGKWIQHR